MNESNELKSAEPGLPEADGSGYESLWLWFGLSYAGWLTLLRVLMHEMPDEWQGKMATLLREYDETFSEWPNDFEDARVQLTHNGRFVSAPEWITNYRHPDIESINRLRPNRQSHRRRAGDSQIEMSELPGVRVN